MVPAFARQFGPIGIRLLLVPRSLEPDFAAHQIGDGKPVEMPHERLDAVGQNMPQAADGGYDAAIAGFIETFDKVSGIFETADDLADIDRSGGLVQQQSAAATADAVDEAFRDQSLGDLHHVVLRDAILSGNFGDRVVAVIRGQIHQGAQRIIGLDGQSHKRCISYIAINRQAV